LRAKLTKKKNHPFNTGPFGDSNMLGEGRGLYVTTMKFLFGQIGLKWQKIFTKNKC